MLVVVMCVMLVVVMLVAMRMLAVLVVARMAAVMRAVAVVALRGRGDRSQHQTESGDSGGTGEDDLAVHCSLLLVAMNLP